MKPQLGAASRSWGLRFEATHRTSIASLLIGIALVGASPAQAQHRFVSGEILVKYAPGVGAHEIANLNAAHGARVLETIPELGVYRLSIPGSQSVSAAIDEIRRDPRIENAEPNYMGEGGDFIPMDTYFDRLWHLNNTGQSGGTPDADIDAVEGWQITRGNESITVAVLDSGIDFGHPEFAGRVLPGFDFVDEDNDPSADHPHGVWVSGILAANADNLYEVAGVDHFAQILPVKVLDSRNFGSSMDLAQGLVFAADQGADVINMSLIGYPINGSTRAALQYARDAGVILIACAGNGGIGDADRSGPGKSPLTISVGATTRFDDRAGFSGTGSALDVVAPGESVPTVAASYSGDAYDSFSGCSAATPVVSGIASLLLSVDPFLTHDEVREILSLTADDQVGPPEEDTPGRDDFFGYGRVNLHQALLEVPEPEQSFQLAAGVILLALLTCSRRKTPSWARVFQAPRECRRALRDPERLLELPEEFLGEETGCHARPAPRHRENQTPHARGPRGAVVPVADPASDALAARLPTRRRDPVHPKRQPAPPAVRLLTHFTHPRSAKPLAAQSNHPDQHNLWDTTLSSRSPDSGVADASVDPTRCAFPNSSRHGRPRISIEHARVARHAKA